MSMGIVQVRDQLSKTRAALAKAREKVEGVVPEVVSGVEVFGGSVGGGFVDEAFGEPDANGIKEHKIMGVPTNLGVGGALFVAGAVGLAGKHGSHLCDVGKGFLAAYGTNLGRTLGADYRAKNP